MALVAKSVTAAAPQGVTAQRGPASGPRSPVATFNAAIEASNPAAGASLAGSFETIVDQDASGFGGRPRYEAAFKDYRDVPTPRTGVIDTPTQSFVSMMELRDTYDVSQVIGEKSAKKLIGRLVGNAVAQYEANAQSAAGEQSVRGDTLSLTL